MDGPNICFLNTPFGRVRAEFLCDSYNGGAREHRAHVTTPDEGLPVMVNGIAYVIRTASFRRTAHYNASTNERLPDSFYEWPTNQYVRRTDGDFGATLTENAAHKLFKAIATALNAVVDAEPNILKHAEIASLRYEAGHKKTEADELVKKAMALLDAGRELEWSARRIEMEMEGWPATVSLDEAL